MQKKQDQMVPQNQFGENNPQKKGFTWEQDQYRMLIYISSVLYQKLTVKFDVQTGKPKKARGLKVIIQKLIKTKSNQQIRRKLDKLLKVNKSNNYSRKKLIRKYFYENFCTLNSSQKQIESGIKNFVEQATQLFKNGGYFNEFRDQLSNLYDFLSQFIMDESKCVMDVYIIKRVQSKHNNSKEINTKMEEQSRKVLKKQKKECIQQQVMSKKVQSIYQEEQEIIMEQVSSKQSIFDVLEFSNENSSEKK